MCTSTVLHVDEESSRIKSAFFLSLSPSCPAYSGCLINVEREKEEREKSGKSEYRT